MSTDTFSDLAFAVREFIDGDYAVWAVHVDDFAEWASERDDVIASFSRGRYDDTHALLWDLRSEWEQSL